MLLRSQNMKLPPEKIAEMSDKKRRKTPVRPKFSYGINNSPLARHSKRKISSPRPVSNDLNVKSLRNRAIKWNVRHRVHRSPPIVVKNERNDGVNKLDSKYFSPDVVNSRNVIVDGNSPTDNKFLSDFLMPKFSPIPAETVVGRHSRTGLKPKVTEPNLDIEVDTPGSDKFEYFAEENDEYYGLNFDSTNLSFENLSQDMMTELSSVDERLSVIKSDLFDRIDVVEAITMKFDIARRVLPIVGESPSDAELNFCTFCSSKFENVVDHEWECHMKHFVSTPDGVPLPCLFIGDHEIISQSTPTRFSDHLPRFTIPFVTVPAPFVQQRNRLRLWFPAEHIHHYPRHCYPRCFVPKYYVMPSPITFPPRISHFTTEDGGEKTYYSL